jgi:ferric-dicitrate binding protein FerR (iron transport regulator)
MDEQFQTRLRELDARLGEVELPKRLERRVLASVGEERGGTSRGLVLAGMLAAAVLAFWLGRGTRVEPKVIVVEAPQPAGVVMPVPMPGTPVVARPAVDVIAWNGALVAEGDCVPVGDDELTLPADCRVRLREPALTIETWEPTRLVAARDGVRVLDGAALFAVETVAPGRPRARVEVAGGAIEVLGTHFGVVQHGDDGHVDLIEGAIAFVDRAGGTHAIEAGRRARWSARGLIEGPRSAVSTIDRDDLDPTLDQVAALRRAGRWRDAVELLHRARRRLGDVPAAEILSYEEGTLRAHDEDAPAMCAYWRGHLARFGEGEHAPSARAQLAHAGCGAP